MNERLYKVSEPRAEWTFAPRRFWRAEDWSFSDDRPHDGLGLVEDCVLYAGSFDEVNIHLFPRVWRLRVWLDDEARCHRLRSLGFSWAPSSRAVIFALERDRAVVESFSPTIFAFDGAGFDRTPTNEWVSRAARTAVSVETLPLVEALERWQVELIYVADWDALVAALRSARVDHQIQT